MADHLSKDEFIAHIGPIREDIAEIIKLQREQNGRVSKAETQIAILEDRSPGRVASGVSAVVSGVITGLGLWFSSQK
jgi:hypothetical protein